MAGDGSTDVVTPPTSEAASSGKYTQQPTVDFRTATRNRPTSTLLLPADDQERSPNSIAVLYPPTWPRVSGYEILSELGRGSMGVVYKARQASLNRVVALKMVRTGAQVGPADLERFLDEARVVALLQHPNIIQIYDVGEQDGLPFFSMEYVEGGSLASLLRGKPQPPRPAARLLETLARAVHVSHLAGIIHRDLKPGNILVANQAPTSQFTARSTQEQSRPDAVPDLPSETVILTPLAQGIPKITDFGLAKQLDGGRGDTQTGVVMGTPNYMAPEQAEGRSREVGPAADIYALGAILYEFLTGRTPYVADSAAEAVVQIFTAEPVAVSRLAPRCPRDLETICLKCLQRDPHKRYISAEALADDLRRFLDGEPILARPASLVEQLWKWARRRPAAATLLACVAAATLGVAALGGWYQADLRTRLEEARLDERTARTAELEATRRAWLTEQRARVQALIQSGQTALVKQDWHDAQLELVRASEQAATDPDLADLRTRAGDLLGQARRLEEERERYQAFQRKRNEALFNATLFTGEDLASGLNETKAAACAALGLYGVQPGTDTALALDSPHLTADEKAAVTAGCYELLLVLADAVAQPLPGQDEAEQHRQATEAVRFLDHAARFGPATRAYHLRRAQYLARQGEATAAQAESQRAQALNVSSSLDHFLVGAELYRQGQLKLAASDFEAALRLQPDHFWAQYYLALVRLRSQQTDLAVAGLTACLGWRPDFAWLYLLRGLALTEVEQFAAAEDDFRQALSQPLNASARYALHLNRGVLRLRQQRSDEAVADFRAAIALNPRLYQGHVNLARTHLQQGRLDEAEQQLQEAIRLEPNLAALYRLQALVAVQRQHVEAALGHLDSALRFDSTSPEAANDQVERSRLLRQQHRLEEALQASADALQLQPRLVAAYRARAECLLELERFPEAVEALTACLELATPTAELHRVRASLYIRLGNYPAALADHTRAVQLQPDAATFTGRGWIYLIQDAPRLALPDFNQAIRLEPGRAEGYAGRGFAQAVLGEAGQAIADAEEALQRGRTSPRVLYGVARIYAQVASRQAAQYGLGLIAAHYEDRAVTLLGEALDLVPASQRPAFWKDYIQADAALSPLHRNAGFLRLTARYVTPR